MKLVNPFGRKESSDLEQRSKLMACMCSNDFSGARTSDDGCFKCGCDCSDDNGGNFYTANRSTAYWTIRSS